MITSLLHALYPEVCVACKRLLYENEENLCLHCLHNLPRTDFFLRKENELFLRLANRISLHSAQALFYFNKKSYSQQLLHAIKYSPFDNKAYWFGTLMGNTWKLHNTWKPDFVVPVPLHSKRKRERGYNQSEALVRGYAEAIGSDVCIDALVRNIHKRSQTKKGKQGRLGDAMEAYGRNDFDFSGKKILLVDDIITTGATIEACGQLLANMKCAELHVYSLSVAMSL
jgi:competence protein ComFC